jgi:hypothetical protein
MPDELGFWATATARESPKMPSSTALRVSERNVPSRICIGDPQHSTRRDYRRLTKSGDFTHLHACGCNSMSWWRYLPMFRPH